MINEKSCGAIIYKEVNGKLFFLVEYMNLGHISLCKGHVEGDEKEVETALREIKEETNIDVEINTSFRETIFYSPYENAFKEVVYFLAKVINDDNVIDWHDEEVKQSKFYSFEKAYELLTYDNDKSVLKKAYAYLTSLNYDNKSYYFCSPTKIYFGNNQEEKVGQYIKEYGFNNILLVRGKKSALKSGLLDKVIWSLKKENISFDILSDIEANPTLEKVNEGIKMYLKKPYELILAVGGGSVIDTSKLIAHGVFYKGNAFDFNLKKVIPTKALPIGVILTIPAAGSELSTSCVIQDKRTLVKQGFNSETNRPLFVIENPYLTLDLPRKQIAYGIVDILAHSMERYFSLSKEIEFADYMALGLMKATVDAFYRLKENFYDLEARKVLLLSSSYSHNGFTSITKPFVMPVHQLEHVLSGRHQEIAHGEGLAILFPFWMEEICQYDVKKFAKFARVVFNVIDEDDLEASYKGIKAYKLFLSELNLSETLKELNVKEEEVELMAQSFATRIIPGIKDLDYSLAKKIFEKAWKGE